jgi:amidase
MEATIADITAAYESGELTAAALTRAYLDRIEAYDRRGPTIRALITVNPTAVDDAKALDRERAQQGPRGPLHGIPVIIKDNYDTAGLPTSAGSVLLADSVPANDAFTVARLRAAGVVIIGKANMSEFALSFDRLSHSSLGGVTRNPYNLNRNVAGSSSGSAAAVAANFAVFATGTDTAGSIRAPASTAAGVGIRPTLGLTSRSGVVPVALSLDVTGPMARTVADAALALQVMAGVDEDDPRTEESDGRGAADYAAFLDADALAGARLGVVRGFFGANAEVDAAMEAALEAMRSQGATIVDVELPAVLLNAWPALMGPVVDRELEPQLDAYLQTLPAGGPRSLAELLAGYRALPSDGPYPPVSAARLDYYAGVVGGPGLADTGYLFIVTNRLPSARGNALVALAEQTLDALVFPTMSCPASPLFTVEDDPAYACDADDPFVPGYVSCVTGFPEITVPAGMTSHGLPVGISFFGRPYAEPRLIALAYAFEQATRARRPPPATPPLD